ncbi:IclR family transcriptional regulator [soil metagenome]
MPDADELQAVPQTAKAGRTERRDRAEPGAADGAAVDAANAAPAARGKRIREVPAVRRATSILELLARSRGGLTLSKLARDLEIIPSTCLHILRELMAAHLVAFEPKGKTYRLGLGLLALSKGLRTHDAFIITAEQHIERFAQEHGISVSAQERDESDAVIVATATAGEGLEAPLGRRVALLSAAGGKLFAGHVDWTRAQMLEQFERVPWQNPPDLDDWLEDVEVARQRGYAIDSGTFRLGVTSIAASVPDRNGLVNRVISINVVTAQVDAQRLSALVRALKATATDIAEALP